MMGLANGSYMGVQQQQQGQWGVAQVRLQGALVTLILEQIGAENILNLTHK